jgi:hypothetical protein
MPPVPKRAAIEHRHLAGIANHDIAVGDFRDFGFGPDHTGGLDRHGPRSRTAPPQTP